MVKKFVRCRIYFPALAPLVAIGAAIGSLGSTFTAMIHRARGLRDPRLPMLFAYNPFPRESSFADCRLTEVREGPFTCNRVRLPDAPGRCSWWCGGGAMSSMRISNASICSSLTSLNLRCFSVAVASSRTSRWQRQYALHDAERAVENVLRWRCRGDELVEEVAHRGAVEDPGV
jgi:hypothetical protein